MKTITDYLLLPGDEGFLLTFTTQPDQPKTPQFHFDGHTLILLRRPAQAFGFPEIPDNFKSEILKSEQLYIGEENKDGIVIDYIALYFPKDDE